MFGVQTRAYEEKGEGGKMSDGTAGDQADIKIDIRRICKNCMDYDKATKQCLVRYKILQDETRAPMKRKPNQKGCQVFIFAT